MIMLSRAMTHSYENNQLITRKELSVWLRVTPQCISNRVSRGDDLPPSIKFGGVRRWRVIDVNNWINERIEHTTLDCFLPQNSAQSPAKRQHNYLASSDIK